MSDSTVCDVNGILILRPMKERERERERTKKERAAFLRVSFGDVCLEDVRWVSHSYEEVEYARGNERLCDERRVTVRLPAR